MVIGITGHRHLDDPSAWDWVRHEIRALLTPMPRPLVGMTALAIGADQVFAEVVLKLQGKIEVVIPFVGYEKTFKNEVDLLKYRRLRSVASRIETLENSVSEEESYLLAGKKIVDCCDLLIAVWNGQPAHGLGGTADIVTYAILTGKQWVRLNPVAQEISVSRRR